MLDSLISQQGLEYKLNRSREQSSQNDPNNASSQKSSRPKKDNRFPKRSLINILLIIMTSIEVVVIVRSQVYLHCDLIRSFLNFYADQDLYPELFQGNAFYININNLKELQDHLNYIVKTINSSDVESLVSMNFNQSKISLEVQYRPWLVEEMNQSIYPIDISEGILEPFDSTNLTSLQQFLLSVRYFQFVVDDLDIENDGIYQKYTHRVIYGYYDASLIEVNYEFQISNTLVSSTDTDRPQANFLIFLRIFYLIILFFALLNLYFNASYIRKVLKQFYTSLSHHAHVPQSPIPAFNSETDFTREQIKEIKVNIEANIEIRHITIHNLKWSDYFNVIDFDVIFSVISNSFQIIGNFYLLFGRQHEVIVGIGCLFSWMTIFRALHNYKRIILMYELIKMSIMRVVEFLMSFLIIFMGYVFLGMCLFPKVDHFSSMSSSVVTLAAMMAGDSIAEMTFDSAQKQNRLLVIVYIFSYIILFMHAIHNTLISILKEYFVLKKIEILRYQKIRKGEEDLTYLQEMPHRSQIQLNKLRLKISSDVQRDIILMKKQEGYRKFNQTLRNLVYILENTISREKWENFDSGLQQHSEYSTILEYRSRKIKKILEELDTQRIAEKEVGGREESEGGKELNRSEEEEEDDDEKVERKEDGSEEGEKGGREE